MEISRENFRAMIFYDYKCNLTPKQCIDRLHLAFGDEAPSNRTVYNWFAEFHLSVRKFCSRWIPTQFDRSSKWQQRINGIYEVGYAISLVAVLLSLGILTYFRSLRCARITLHMNLFTSFAFNNALWLIWYRFIVANTDLLLNNGVSSEYDLTDFEEAFMNYRGSTLISQQEQHAVSCVRDGKIRCWINEGNYMIALVYPVCVSTLLNIFFLSNIVRVLLMKLRAGPAIGTRPSRSMLQAFRATVLLVPLLGLHYLVVPFRPPKNHPWENFHEVLSAITASFQGLCVAVLFCFCNGEVIAQFKRKWDHSALLRKRANSCTATTVSVCRERISINLSQSIDSSVASKPRRLFGDAECDSSVPESSPLWNVDCFSLSARPQVRWRERRRCDYQPAAAVPRDDDCNKRLTNEDQQLQQPQQTVQVIAAGRQGNHGNNNHTRVFVKRGGDGDDFSHDECDQTQC
ncbi:Calcitonin-like peptide type 1 receptor [Trachymyrmex septentrionalis]|uniref:Calcitonin-like peptide type 1 receptor n=1 Tax=Trachymyrmex septentrionalis TaxID=34720 RepID=A0A195EU67_9HYME|nr:Calcitonin-like peptide type 1 receptor [Trachymyrmex septentrionalis]